MGRPLKPSTPFAERLVCARGERSRAEIAAALGCPVETLGNYERGRTFPDLLMLGRMRRVLGISLDWLLTGEGGMSRGGTPPPVVPLDEDFLVCIAKEIVAVYAAAGQLPSTLTVVEMAAAWYGDLSMACASAAERAVGLRALLQHLRRVLGLAAQGSTGSHNI